MNSKKGKPKTRIQRTRDKKSSPLFVLLIAIPFGIFLISAMFGSILKQDRISSEFAFENRLGPVERAWRGLKLKVYAYEYGPDYRNKIPENEGRALGLLRESLLESVLPRYLFLFLTIAFPFYFFLRLIKENPADRKSVWPQSSKYGSRKTSPALTQKKASR